MRTLRPRSYIVLEGGWGRGGGEGGGRQQKRRQKKYYVWLTARCYGLMGLLCDLFIILRSQPTNVKTLHLPIGPGRTQG